MRQLGGRAARGSGRATTWTLVAAGVAILIALAAPAARPAVTHSADGHPLQLELARRPQIAPGVFDPSQRAAARDGHDDDAR